MRIVPNCLNTAEQEKYKKDLLPIINKREGFFFQTKSYSVYKNCYIGYLKPFLNADGNIYHCSAAPLYNLKFSEPWKICHMKDIKKVWPDNLPKMDTSHCQAGKCFYSEQNELIDSLFISIEDEDFI